MIICVHCMGFVLVSLAFFSFAKDGMGQNITSKTLTLKEKCYAFYFLFTTLTPFINYAIKQIRKCYYY